MSPRLKALLSDSTTEMSFRRSREVDRDPAGPLNGEERVDDFARFELRFCSHGRL